MILLISNEQDLTTDFVVLELRRRRAPFVRFNSEQIAKSKISFSYEGDHSFVITLDKSSFNLRDVAACYYRRPGQPHETLFPVSEAGRAYALEEWNEIAKAVWSIVNSVCLNSPKDIAFAECKPLQLIAAQSMGFNVPPTLVTNSADALTDFSRRHPIVGKTLRHALLSESDSDSVIFTSQLQIDDLQDPRQISIAPAIYQKRVADALDVRVIAVGDKLFPVSIMPEHEKSGIVDWRTVEFDKLSYSSHCLPNDIADRCRSIVVSFGLRFSAIDLLLDDDGRYWFLELNPNGQWAWLESRMGLPISAAIVDELEAIACSSSV